MEAPYNVMKIQGHLINKTLRKFMFLQFAKLLRNTLIKL